MSFLILNSCSSAGMLGEISNSLSHVLQLHRSATASMCVYALEVLQNGNYTAAIDMIRFQTQKMNCSIQLLHAKSAILDVAPLVGYHHKQSGAALTSAKQIPVQLIGSIHGLVGNDITDGARALQMLAHSSDRHSATSLIKECSEAAGEYATLSLDCAYSDNRDLEVCQLGECLTIPKTQYCLDIARLLASFPSKKELVMASLSVGHIYAILVKTAILISAVKPFLKQPGKKGQLRNITRKSQ